MRKPITSAIVAILFGFFVATIVLASAGYDPVEAFGALIDGMIGKPKYIANVIIKATPLLFTGVAVAFAFRVGLFNIGAEGQCLWYRFCHDCGHSSRPSAGITDSRSTFGRYACRSCRRCTCGLVES